jgi:N-methylhydantoinase A/oxoprolinase/acetone carboxylase beta subunit
MTITLGIDTGGTYTDAVLVDQASGAVLAGAKALTTYHDLSVGIGQAVAAVLATGATDDGQPVTPARVDMVALSTTLATNAIVEGRGSAVCLLLIGYDPQLIHDCGFERELVTQNVVYIRGGHTAAGDQAVPLDEAALRAAILAFRDKVEAFAISSYFSVRNPAHELRAAELVAELTADRHIPGNGFTAGDPLPVTCGHELTTRLNAVRRATTTALNAGLIPSLRELINAVRQTLNDQGIAAPLMVVKGDGSLVRAEWALLRPIETVLAGPAASLVGAWHLAGRQDGWVVDMGGTTTDIASLHDGRPRLSEEGAHVGRWRTMVEAVDVQTAGLGGDSEVTVDANRTISVGPRRVVPLCLLASQYPSVHQELAAQAAAPKRDRLAGQFALAQRRAAVTLDPAEQQLLDTLAQQPQSLQALVKNGRLGALTLYRLSGMEARRLILRAGFTPTDALHVLGRFDRWDAEASRCAAELLARPLGLTAEAFCERVAAQVSQQVATELVSKALADAGAAPDWGREPAATALLARALGDGHEVPGLDCQLSLQQPVIAIGAPVSAYLPAVSGQLHAGLVIPPHAEVANAVGAVVGGVVQQLRANIYPVNGGEHFRLHLPDGVCDFPSVAEAIDHARSVMPAQVAALARRAGADQVEISEQCENVTAPIGADYGQEVYIETHLSFTAAGRPGLTRVEGA